jgi:S1-C subfamily serine protease
VFDAIRAGSVPRRSGATLIHFLWLVIQSVTISAGLAEAINRHKPGDSITVTALRGQQSAQIRVALGELLPG